MNRTDLQLKRDIEDELLFDPKVNSAEIGVSVTRGVVTLHGVVHDGSQKGAAEAVARRAAAGRLIEEQLEVRLPVRVRHGPSADAGPLSIAGVREHIEAALLRQAASDARSIRVDAKAGIVTLSGEASSWHAIDDAVTAAWGAPGVTDVVVHLQLGARRMVGSRSP